MLRQEEKEISMLQQRLKFNIMSFRFQSGPKTFVIF